jgi:hypothetical protein
VTSFSYGTGQEVRVGDLITYHGESGHVQFVVAEPTGDPSLDWYLAQFPGGGVMIEAEGFGSVFLRADDIDEEVEFVSRATGKEGAITTDR